MRIAALRMQEHDCCERSPRTSPTRAQHAPPLAPHAARTGRVRVRVWGRSRARRRQSRRGRAGVGQPYDANGNITSKSGEATYGWDFDNRLTEVNLDERHRRGASVRCGRQPRADDRHAALSAGGTNVACSGNSAVFGATDTVPQGSWKGVYGADGQYINAEMPSPPTYGSVSFSNTSNFTWTANTTDVRALQQPPPGTSRIASTWYSATNETFHVVTTDSNEHTVAFYMLTGTTTGSARRRRRRRRRGPCSMRRGRTRGCRRGCGSSTMLWERGLRVHGDERDARAGQRGVLRAAVGHGGDDEHARGHGGLRLASPKQSRKPTLPATSPPSMSATATSYSRSCAPACPRRPGRRTSSTVTGSAQCGRSRTRRGPRPTREGTKRLVPRTRRRGPTRSHTGCRGTCSSRTPASPTTAPGGWMRGWEVLFG